MEATPVANPANPEEIVGEVAEASVEQAEATVGIAVDAAPAWAARPAEDRRAILHRVAGRAL